MASIVQDKTATATVRSGASQRPKLARPVSSRAAVNSAARSSHKAALGRTTAFDITRHHHPVYEVSGLPKAYRPERIAGHENGRILEQDISK